MRYDWLLSVFKKVSMSLGRTRGPGGAWRRFKTLVHESPLAGVRDT